VEVVHLPSRERAIADRPQAVVIFAGDLGHRSRFAMIAYEQQQRGTIGHASVYSQRRRLSGQLLRK
jgi:hypothetical protein